MGRAPRMSRLSRLSHGAPILMVPFSEVNGRQAPTISAMLSPILLLVALDGAAYPPAKDSHVNDLAGVLSESDAARIRSVAGSVLREKAVPIVVATIQSLADQGAAGWSI